MKWRYSFITLIIAACCTVLIARGAHALDVPATPALNRPVVDQTKTLSDDQINTLSDTINYGREQKDYQIGVLIIPTLGNGEYLEGYSLKVARAWGIGDKATSRGVLLLIVKNDRKLRIEVGRGLEGELTDVESGRIIRNVITPKFKTGDYYGGISAGLGSIQAQVEGRSDPASAATTNNSNSGDMIVTLISVAIMFLTPGIMWVLSILARSKSWWLGGVIGAVGGALFALIVGWSILGLAIWAILAVLGFILDYVISKNYREHAVPGQTPAWWAGGVWGGGSGGGSSSGGSFGGGSFGGGGSSGSW